LGTIDLVTDLSLLGIFFFNSPWFLFTLWIFRELVACFTEYLAGVFKGMFADVGNRGRRSRGDVVCCSARVNPENWVCGKRESGVCPQAVVYLATMACS